MTLFGSAAAAAGAGRSDAVAPIDATQSMMRRNLLRGIPIPGKEGGAMYHIALPHATPPTYVKTRVLGRSDPHAGQARSRAAQADPRPSRSASAATQRSLHDAR